MPFDSSKYLKEIMKNILICNKDKNQVIQNVTFKYKNFYPCNIFELFLQLIDKQNKTLPFHQKSPSENISALKVLSFYQSSLPSRRLSLHLNLFWVPPHSIFSSQATVMFFCPSNPHHIILVRLISYHIIHKSYFTQAIRNN